MANKWLAHVKKTMKAHKGKDFGEVLKMAKKTYKKGMKGGADVAPFTENTDISVAGPSQASPSAPVRDAAPVGGRRRSRKSRKSRKGSRRA